MLAPPAGANTVTGEPARTGSALAKTSRAFAALSYNELQSYTEAMADPTKWRAAIKSELDSHIENGPGKRVNYLHGDVRSRPRGYSRLR